VERGKNFLFCILLTLFAVLPYLPLRHGQFLHDDYQVILKNDALAQVQSFGDCFRFVLKPSKPVTNFFLALGSLLGPGTSGQRTLSLIFHAGVVILIFLILQSFCRRWELGNFIPFFTALLFAVSPIHSEAVIIALFRMEILGAFFCLLGVWIALSKMHDFQKAVFCFLCIGLSGFSKETFLPIALVLITAALTYEKNKSMAKWLGAFSLLIYGPILFVLLSRDSQSNFPYSDVIGIGKISAIQHVRLAGEAVAEGILKIFTGEFLTSIPLIHRMPRLALPIQLAALALFWSSLFLLKEKRWAALGAAALFSYSIYLVIPNLNIGSEHYWYFPAIGIYILIVGALDSIRRLNSRVLSPLFALLLVIYVGFFSHKLTLHLGDMRTRLSWHLSELENHSDSFMPWNNVTVALLETGSQENINRAGVFLVEAKRRAPGNPIVHATAYYYYEAIGDKTRAENSLERFKDLMHSTREKAARYSGYFQLPR
jgi:hypothetical protein